MRIGFHGTGTAVRHLRPEVAGPEHEVPPEPHMMDQDTAEYGPHATDPGSGPKLAAPRAYGTITRGTGEWRARLTATEPTMR